MTRTKRTKPGGGPNNHKSKKNKFRMSEPSLASSSKQKFYAVQKGRDGYSGVLNTWEECTFYVTGVKGAIFKSFNTHEEALIFSTLAGDGGASNPRPPAPTFPAAPVGNAADVAGDGNINLDTVGNIMNLANLPSAADKARAAAGADSVIDLEADDWKSQAKKSAAAEKEASALAAAASAPARPLRLTVYTDGACSNNGRWNSLAGYGVFFEEGSPYNISEPLNSPHTNQRAEMMAALAAMQVVIKHKLVAYGGFLQIRTDSQYTKNGIEKWVAGWKASKWRTASGSLVKNKDLWVALDKTRIALLEMRIQLELVWVKGHAGCPGNEAADRLAVAGAQRAKGR